MGVQDLAATDFAFAAICGEQRSVVTWGSPHYGGDSSWLAFFGACGMHHFWTNLNRI